MFEDANRSIKILFSGGFAGGISRTCTAPLDRIKILMMVEDGAKAMSLSDVLQKMRGEGTIKAYFKGNGTNVLKIAPETAIKLTASDRLKYYIAENPDCIGPQERFLSGALAGGLAQFTIYPLEVIKTRLAVSKSEYYRGIFDAARRIHSEEGLSGFYRGLTPSLIGILPYAGVDIAIFEILMEHLAAKYNGDPPGPLILGAGMLSSSFAQFVSFPLAVVRTRLQNDGIGGGPRKYDGMTDVFIKTVANEGWRGLYKGLVPNMLKVAPAAGITWLVFEKTKQLLGLNGPR